MCACTCSALCRSMHKGEISAGGGVHTGKTVREVLEIVDCCLVINLHLPTQFC